ncbi:MAG TPA: hypothetical protein VEF03_03050, partial [Candidatus Binataceae bacterium]|nr:hypothetical protein [Candidatus Binataceae bacterium]
SGIVNLARNIGASVGISMVTTIVARRTQTHQSRLIEHITPYSLGMDKLLTGPGSLINRGAPTQQSYGMLYGRVIEQAATKAFVDAVWAMAIVAFVMIPFAMMLRRAAPGALRIGAH